MKTWLRETTLPVKVQALAAACSRIQHRTDEKGPGYRDIALLALAWGNLGYAAGFSYLKHIGERVRGTSGPILECGSGATTLLIAALTADRDAEFVVLEHDLTWYEYLRRVLDALGYSHVNLVYAPLSDYGAYRWYQVPASGVPGEIRLVICDGPPGSIQGGRYGLMPVMKDSLADDCVILLDDTHRKEERRIVDVWGECRCLKANRIGRFGTHAEVEFC